MEIQKLVLKFEKELLEEKDKIVKEKEAIEVKELTKNAFSNADYNILLEKDIWYQVKPLTYLWYTEIQCR